MLSRAACTSRGTCRSFETTRRARSASARSAKSAWPARLVADDVGVDLRIALPGPHRLQLVHPRLDVRGDDRVLDLFGRRQVRRRRSDGAAGRSRPGRGRARRWPGGSGPRAGRHGGGRRPGWPGWEAPRGDRRGSRRRNAEMAPMGTCPVMTGALCRRVEERASLQWYNNRPSHIPRCPPARCSWSPRPSATSRTSRCGRCGCCAKSDCHRRRRHPADGQAAGASRHLDADGQLPRAQHAARGFRSCSPGSRPGSAWRWSPTPGHPGVSDPGVELVRRVSNAGFAVDPVPGASAPSDRR